MNICIKLKQYLAQQTLQKVVKRCNINDRVPIHNDKNSHRILTSKAIGVAIILKSTSLRFFQCDRLHIRFQCLTFLRIRDLVMDGTICLYMQLIYLWFSCKDSSLLLSSGWLTKGQLTPSMSGIHSFILFFCFSKSTLERHHIPNLIHG